MTPKESNPIRDIVEMLDSAKHHVPIQEVFISKSRLKELLSLEGVNSVKDLEAKIQECSFSPIEVKIVVVN